MAGRPCGDLATPSRMSHVADEHRWSTEDLKEELVRQGRVLARALATLVACVVALSGLVAAPAAAGELRRTASVPGATEDAFVEIAHVKSILEPYVTRSSVDGTFQLDAPSSVVESITPETMAHVSEGMAFINDMIRAGQLVSTPDLQAYPVGQGPNTGTMHHGVNRLDCDWISCTVYLDDENTRKLLVVMQSGGGIAGITATLCGAFGLLPCSIPAGVAAGILAIGAGVINLCSNSHGVKIRTGIGAHCTGQ